MCLMVMMIHNARRPYHQTTQHVATHAAQGKIDGLKKLLLNLKKKFGGDWKDAEQSCVIHSITYDSDHLVIKSFINSDSG